MAQLRPAKEKRRTAAMLRPGEIGIVADVLGNDALCHRLLDLGITPGVMIIMRKTAPMGDPIEVGLRGYVLTLRRSDAARIMLRELMP